MYIHICYALYIYIYTCVGCMETVLAETILANIAVYAWWCTEGIQNYLMNVKRINLPTWFLPTRFPLLRICDAIL